MNIRSAPYEHTGTVLNAGTTPATGSLPNPHVNPMNGWLYRLRVVQSSGASTVATIEFVNTSTSEVVSVWPNYSLPFDAADVAVSFTSTNPGHMRVRITTDDASNTSNFDIYATIGAF